MTTPWIPKMQDLSVDKAVDSVNKIKWTQMGASGIIVKTCFT